MLHVINARCVARDLHTTGPGPLERTCWRRFAAQCGDCKKSRIVPLNRIIIYRNWQTYVPDTWKVTQQNLPRQESVRTSDMVATETLLLHLVHHMETPVFWIKVTVHRRSPRLQ